jgi:hypothetical protein
MFLPRAIKLAWFARTNSFDLSSVTTPAQRAPFAPLSAHAGPSVAPSPGLENPTKA